MDSYLLLTLAILVPILYGADLTVCGPITAGHMGSFENNLKGSSWWLDHIILWSLVVQVVAIADKGALKGKKHPPHSLQHYVCRVCLHLFSGSHYQPGRRDSIAFSTLKDLMKVVDLLKKPPLPLVNTFPGGRVRPPRSPRQSPLITPSPPLKAKNPHTLHGTTAG